MPKCSTSAKPGIATGAERCRPRLFHMIDVDQSGTLQVSEFVGPLSRWAHDSKTATWNLFREGAARCQKALLFLLVSGAKGATAKRTIHDSSHFNQSPFLVFLWAKFRVSFLAAGWPLPSDLSQPRFGRDDSARHRASSSTT